MNNSQRELFEIAKKSPNKIITNENGLWLDFAKEFLTIKDDEGVVLPFVPTKAQRRFLGMYWDAKREGVQFRAVVNKPRQIGSSTLMAMIYLTEACLIPNSEILIAANQKDGAADNIFQKYVDAIRLMPQNKSKNDRQIFAKGGLPGSGRIQLRNSKSIVHKIGEKIEVGRTISAIILSECAHYHDFDEVMKHVLPAVRTGNSKSVVLESTAKGFGDAYHEYFQLAEQGTGGWQMFFSPWFECEKYVEEIAPEEHNDFISSIGTNPKMYGDEIELRDHYKLTPEQLKWRRTTIEGDCKGVLSTFRMNYPVSSTEAFGSADAPLFHTPSLDWFKKLIAPPIRTGRMEMVEKGGLRASGNEEFVFVDDNSGAIELWEEPSEFDEYVWASDHAEGLPSKDSNVALIAKRNPFKIVCKIKGNDNTKLQLLEFSRQLTYLLEWFGRPQGLPEANNQGSAILSHFEDWGFLDCIMWEYEAKRDAASSSNRQGFYMTHPAKKAGYDILTDVMRIAFETNDQGKQVGIAANKHTPSIPDAEIINELYNIITDGKKIYARKKGKVRLPGSSDLGYSDDLADTLMLLVLAHKNLPEPAQREEIMIRKLGRNHPLTQDLDHIHIYDAIEDSQKPHNQENFVW